MQDVKTLLDRVWAKKPAHLHRLELFSASVMHVVDGAPLEVTYGRIDLDCNWVQDVTLEERLAVFMGDQEMIDRFLQEKKLKGESLSKVIAQRQWTETKHLYFEEPADPADVARRVLRAVELLPDMARWQPIEAHHQAIDLNEFRGERIHKLFQTVKWDSVHLLPADYSKKPKERIARAALPKVV
jgi:hypothetical protein